MALVGSGTSQVKNFATAASLTASDLDESLAAFVEQLGGVKWLNGVSARCAGNLTYDNFVTGLSLPNAIKREPRSVWVHSIDVKSIAATAVPFHVGGWIVPVNCFLDRWSVSVYVLTSSKTADPVVTMYLNGSAVAVTPTMTVGTSGGTHTLYRSVQSVGAALMSGSKLAVVLTAGGSALTELSVASHLVLSGDHL